MQVHCAIKMYNGAITLRMLRVKYGDVGCKGKGGSSWEEENYDHDVWTVDGLFALLPFRSLLKWTQSILELLSLRV